MKHAAPAKAAVPKLRDINPQNSTESIGIKKMVLFKLNRANRSGQIRLGGAAATAT
jgi:hypothetical protein